MARTRMGNFSDKRVGCSLCCSLLCSVFLGERQERVVFFLCLLASKR